MGEIHTIETAHSNLVIQLCCLEWPLSGRCCCPLLTRGRASSEL